MLKALLFDLDGTLAETDSVHRPTWSEVLRPYGIEVDGEFYRENISGRIGTEIVADLLPDLSDREAREIADAKESSFREQAAKLEPLPGLVDVVEEGRSRGLRVALVTNAPMENVAAVLRALGLQDDFDEIVLAEEVGRGKPDPAPYRAALDRLGIAPEDAVAFEDSTSGIASSVAAGITTVGICSTQPPEKLRRAGASVVVQDFTDPKVRELFLPS